MGYNVQSLAVLAIVFVVAGITIAMGALVVDDVQDVIDSDGSYADNVTDDTLEGLETFGEWMPTIAIVLMAAIVIGILLFAFKFSQ